MKNILITITAVLFLTSCGNKKSEEETSETPTIENITTFSDAQIKNAGIQIGKIEEIEIFGAVCLRRFHFNAERFSRNEAR